ncbi:uncharacterized protein LTR77_005115 [Saxophila tyrrhenica]|uniref:Azaphilone pigments biosynthesis cluster protein L N-terminal domain-containing protein n=1 Tax=Saxophila tyrrhenica TaxID=1690608 RepID=A0AAV9PEG3_9PEZI|nr:hypothetical protein LTR77_005115 [Saxophila tyrrhenica]
MSGLQEIAAIVGIADAGFRSISALYDFLSSLRTAPAEIATLRNHISTLQRTLSVLSSVKGSNVRTQDLTRQVGLPHAIDSCGQACDKLRKDLERWTKSGSSNWKAQIQFRWHRKLVEAALAEIGHAKETTLLAVVVTQLCLQLQGPISENQITALVSEARITINTMSPSNTQSNFSGQGFTVGSTAVKTETKQDPSANPPGRLDADQQSRLQTMIDLARNKAYGENNAIGADKAKIADGSLKSVAITDNDANGTNNRIGVW